MHERSNTIGKPHILIMTADQVTSRALAAYGSALLGLRISTPLPLLTSYADFTYCNSPIRLPSRYAFMTGKSPSTIEAFGNSADLPSDAVTFAHHLRHARCQIILSGKIHFCSVDQMHRSEKRLTAHRYPADYGWTPNWQQSEVRPSWYRNMSSVIDAPLSSKTNQLDFGDELLFAAEKNLYDIARGTDTRQFCMVVSMTHSHQPYAISEPYWNQYRNDEIDMPQAARQPELHSSRLHHAIDIGSRPVTRQQIRDVRHDLHNEIQNLTVDLAFANRWAESREENPRWNLSSLQGQVLASQRRQFVFTAPNLGKQQSQDYQSIPNANRQFLRNHLNLDSVEAKARFPAVRAVSQ